MTRTRKVHAAGGDGITHACDTAGTDLDVGNWDEVTCEFCRHEIDECLSAWGPIPIDEPNPFSEYVGAPGIFGMARYIRLAIPEAVQRAYWESLLRAQIHFCREFLERHRDD